MCSSAFSDFKINNVSNGASISSQNSKKQVQKPTIEHIEQNEKTSENDKNAMIKNIAPTVLALGAIPLTAFFTHKYSFSQKNMTEMKEEMQNLKRNMNQMKAQAKKTESELKKQTEELKNKAEKQGTLLQNNDARVWAAISAAAGLTGVYAGRTLSQKDKEDVSNTFSQRVDNINNTAQTAIYKAQVNMDNLSEKYLQEINGVKLLNNPSIGKRNQKAYEKAIETIENEAGSRLNEEIKLPLITTNNPTFWSITSEFAPIKEGGLGTVPVDIQDNFTKLGINTPSFVPIYQQKGVATLEQNGDKYLYKYNKAKLELQKAASFKMDVFKNGKSQTEDVEIFVANLEKDPSKPKRQVIFIKNDNYFDGAIYNQGIKNEEPEKFAFFSKAVYEFAKLKLDDRSVKNPQIFDKNLLDSIKKPDGIILNDWQASPFAALARYKAPMENAHGELSKDAADNLSNMRIITIGHNACYQGSTRNDNNAYQKHEATSNILNTLFDNYTYDIVSHSKTRASEDNPKDELLKNLDNVLLIDENSYENIHTNLLNMGVCLSDYFCPVSKNYTNELVEYPEKSQELHWALRKRNDNKSLIGIVNGNDFDKNSIEGKQNFINDKSLMTFKTYNKTSAVDDVIKARTKNKIAFYNDFMKPFSKKNDTTINDPRVDEIRKLTSGSKEKKFEKISYNLDFIETKGKHKILPDLTDEELQNTPIVSSVGRLVNQKGIDIMSEAIKMTMENWEKDFPGKSKPIFYLGGTEGENGENRAAIEKMMSELSQENSNRVIFAHGFAPTAVFAAASDFFLLPSRFEPCGLTQGESFAVGTPVIASSVGGILDTVNRNNKENGILTEKEDKLTPQKLYEAMKQGFDIYFNDKERYKQMVNNSLQEDLSWIQPNKQGPIFEYLDLLGVDTANLASIN